jgi:hypothetical protein
MKTTTTYTEKEKQVLQACLEIQKDGIFCIYTGDIEQYSCIDSKILRGVLSSLVKKNALDVNTEDGGLISIFDDNYRVEEE